MEDRAVTDTLVGFVPSVADCINLAAKVLLYGSLTTVACFGVYEQDACTSRKSSMAAMAGARSLLIES
jgi:hypothetical protein